MIIADKSRCVIEGDAIDVCVDICLVIENLSRLFKDKPDVVATVMMAFMNVDKIDVVNDFLISLKSGMDDALEVFADDKT